MTNVGCYLSNVNPLRMEAYYSLGSNNTTENYLGNLMRASSVATFVQQNLKRVQECMKKQMHHLSSICVKIPITPWGVITLNLHAFVSVKFAVNDFCKRSLKKDTVILRVL